MKKKLYELKIFRDTHICFFRRLVMQQSRHIFTAVTFARCCFSIAQLLWIKNKI